MNKTERVKAQKARTKRALKRIEESNAKAKSRKLAAKAAFDEWRQSKSTDAMVPHTRDDDVDNRPVVDEGPPVRRAYLHTYGFTRHERRMASAIWTSNQRRKQRAIMKQVFHKIWEAGRAHNEVA